MPTDKSRRMACQGGFVFAAHRRARLRFRVTDDARKRRVRTFLEREVWSRIPEGQLGKGPDKTEREEILGYGRGGV